MKGDNAGSKSIANSQRNSQMGNSAEDNAVKEGGPAKDTSQHSSIKISKNEGNLQLGLYTIVEEDKSILNKSRISLSNKKKKSSKKQTMPNITSQSMCEGTLNESEAESIGFQTSSLLKNINIKPDFLSKKLSNKPMKISDFIESSIYDPHSSDEEEQQKREQKPQKNAKKASSKSSIKRVRLSVKGILGESPNLSQQQGDALVPVLQNNLNIKRRSSLQLTSHEDKEDSKLHYSKRGRIDQKSWRPLRRLRTPSSGDSRYSKTTRSDSS